MVLVMESSPLLSLSRFKPENPDCAAFMMSIYVRKAKMDFSGSIMNARSC